jgi:hypothetical protein
MPLATPRSFAPFHDSLTASFRPSRLGRRVSMAVSHRRTPASASAAAAPKSSASLSGLKAVPAKRSRAPVALRASRLKPPPTKDPPRRPVRSTRSPGPGPYSRPVMTELRGHRRTRSACFPQAGAGSSPASDAPPWLLTGTC